MIHFFRTIRRKLLASNRLAKYLVYAIGEIVLVVIGILIALQINNWNQDRIEENKLMKVYERLIVDMDNDIREMGANRNYWEERRPVFLRVKQDSITPDLFDQGLSRLLTTNTVTNFNTTGVNQLREMNQKTELALRIIEVYDFTDIIIVGQEARIQEQSVELHDIFRDNYPWYSEWMSKTIMQDNSSPGLQDYFLNSMEFRHRVIDGYQQIFNNYVASLNGFIDVLSSDRTALKMISDSDFIPIERDKLLQYSGKFVVTAQQGDTFRIEIGDTISVEAYDHFLRITQPNRTVYPVIDLYADGVDSFSNLFDDLQVDLDYISKEGEDSLGSEIHILGTSYGEGEIQLNRVSDD